MLRSGWRIQSLFFPFLIWISGRKIPFFILISSMPDSEMRSAHRQISLHYIMATKKKKKKEDFSIIRVTIEQTTLSADKLDTVL